MNISARLVISGVIVANKEYILSTQPVVIGRENANDLVLKDPEVSRRHARITYQAGQYYIEDLNSTNGTFLNEQRIHVQSPLKHGDVIRFGESIRLTYYGLAVQDAGETFILEEDPQDYIDTPPLEQPVGYQPPPYQQPQYQQPQYQPTQYEPEYAPPLRSPQAGYREPVYSQPRPPVEPFQQGRGIPPAAEPVKERSTTRIILGCGCLLLLIVIACGVSLYLLDSFAPDLLYCGFLEPVVKGFTTLVCP